MIVRVADAASLPWIAARANLQPGPSMRAIEAVDAAGNIRGMVAFDGWTPNSVHVHVAIDAPLAGRHLLLPAFRIPFLELGRGVLLAPVLSINARSLRLVEHLGFREIGRVRDGWERGIDIVMHEMRREECRFLGEARQRRAA